MTGLWALKKCFLVWKYILFFLLITAVLHSLYLLFDKRERQRLLRLIKNKSVNFIDYNNLTLPDVAVLLLNTVLNKKLSLLIISFFFAIFFFFIFYFFFLINMIILVITLIINIDNSLIIKSDSIETDDSFFWGFFFTISKIFLRIIKNLWKIAKIFAYIIVYKFLKRQCPHVAVQYAHKIAISLLIGLPWFILALSIEFTNAQTYDLKKKHRKILYFLYIKHFFKNLMCFLGLKITYLNTLNNMKIILKNKTIRLNPTNPILSNWIRDFINQHGAHTIDFNYLSEPRIWTINNPISWNANTTHRLVHQTFNNPNNLIQQAGQNPLISGLVLTTSQNVKIDNSLYPTAPFGQFNFRSELKKQYAFVSLMSQTDLTSGYLQSVWNNHNLSNPDLFITFKIKLNLIYYLYHADVLPVQLDNDRYAIKFIHGTQNIQTAVNDIADLINHAQQHGGLSSYKLNIIIHNYSSFKSWYRLTTWTPTTKSDFLSLISNTTLNDLHLEITNLANNGHLTTANWTQLRATILNEHNHALTTPNFIRDL